MSAGTWLITGGCGFVGSNLAHALLGSGVEVCVLDNLSRLGSRENLQWLRDCHGLGWRFVEADVRDHSLIARLIREVRPRVIVHLAAQVAATVSIQEPRLDFEVNALGTFNVLEAVRLHSAYSIVIYSSSNKVYGSLAHLRYEETPTRYVLPAFPNGLDESLPVDSCTPYGCSKLAAEQYVRDYHRIYGIRTVVFRHSSMYGGRQFATYDQGWIGWFCQQILSGESFTISGNGKQVRDVLHVNDVVRLYQAAVEGIDDVQGRVFNIGGAMANSLSLLELFALLESLTGRAARYHTKDWRVMDQKVFVADVRQAARWLGWRPELSKEAGIELTLAWIRESAR